jgi:hypothetical protein
MLLPDDLLLEAGALRFSLAGRFLELALTLEASFLEAVGWLFLAGAFLGIGRFETNDIEAKTFNPSSQGILPSDLVALRAT